MKSAEKSGFFIVIVHFPKWYQIKPSWVCSFQLLLLQWGWRARSPSHGCVASFLPGNLDHPKHCGTVISPWRACPALPHSPSARGSSPLSVAALLLNPLNIRSLNSLKWLFGSHQSLRMKKANSGWIKLHFLKPLSQPKGPKTFPGCRRFPDVLRVRVIRVSTPRFIWGDGWQWMEKNLPSCHPSPLLSGTQTSSCRTSLWSPSVPARSCRFPGTNHPAQLLCKKRSCLAVFV